MCLATLGLFILAAYAIHRRARPGKLHLASAPRRHNNLTGLHLCLVLAVMLLVPAGATDLLGKWMGQGDPRVTILVSLLSAAILLPVVLGTAWVAFPMGLARGLGLSARHWFLDGLRAVVAYLAVFPACLLLWWLGTLFPDYHEHSMLTALREVGAGWKALVVFSTVVLAPVVEEIVYRGLLQSTLRNYFRGPWPTVLLASALFAAMHMNPHAFPALFALGVVLGYNYERTGRLLAPMLIHALFNGVSVLNTLLYGMKGS